MKKRLYKKRIKRGLEPISIVKISGQAGISIKKIIAMCWKGLKV